MSQDSGYFSITFYTGPEVFKVKVEYTMFVNKMNLNSKNCQACFSVPQEFGTGNSCSPCQLQPCWSPEALLSGFCISRRVTPG